MIVFKCSHLYFTQNPLSIGFIFIVVCTIFHVAKPVNCEEVGVDSQSLVLSSNNTTLNDIASNQTITTVAPDDPSNKYPFIGGHWPPPPNRPPHPYMQHRPYYHHSPPPYHHSHYHHHPPPLQFYRPRIQLDPVQIDHLANASKHIVGEFVNGIGQAFHNFFTQRARSNGGRLLNGENIIATAAQLLPSSSKLLGRNIAIVGTTAKLPGTLIAEPSVTEEKKTAAANETAQASSKVDTLAYPNGANAINYEVEGQKLRENIVSKVGHLQTVLTTALEVSKERRDLITRRILEQTNYRLEQAKERADRILSEPSNSQIAVRTLYAIDQGISGIHSFLHGLLDRINISINAKLSEQAHNNETITNTTVPGTAATTDKPEESKQQ